MLHSVPPVQHMQRMVRASGCLVVVHVVAWSDHWQLKLGALFQFPTTPSLPLYCLDNVCFLQATQDVVKLVIIVVFQP